MIWKIFFILISLLFAFLQVDGITSTMELTEVNLALGYVLSFVFLFIAGYFFSLGWKKKLYSLKANNIIFSGIILFILLTAGMAVNVAMPQLFIQSAGQNDHTRFIVGILSVALVSLLLYSVIYSPAIVAYFKYKKYYPEMNDVSKPYWKIFLTYYVGILLINTAVLILKYPSVKFNVWDCIMVITVIVDIPFLIGYAYNIKFGKQIIWKIISVPYALFSVAALFLCSDELLQITGSYLVKESYVVMFVYVLTAVAWLYVVYRYSFTKDVYSDTPAKISETVN